MKEDGIGRCNECADEIVEREAHRGLTGTDIEFSSSAASRMNW
jgi:hypothetical protein